MKPIKIGLDIHGVVTQNPKLWAWLTKVIVEAGGEVHIMTGRSFKTVMPRIEKLGLTYTSIFSITDYLLEQGEPVIKKEDEDNLWFDQKVWNKIKGMWAKKLGLDITFDDSIEYAEHFDSPFALLLSACHIAHKDFYKHEKGYKRDNSKKTKEEV